MKSWRLHKPASIESAPLRLEEIPVPEPGVGEVRLQVKACGLCHTDLHEIEGELLLLRRPVTPGHQIVGVIDALGQGVTAFQKGERVGVAWLHGACGSCGWCAEERENLCPQAQFTGYSVDGGYAEYAVAREGFVHRLPKALGDLDAAPLLCAGIIGYRALRLSEIKPGGVLGLFGFGASAHLALQVALHWGSRVMVFSRARAHRQMALRLGAAWAGETMDQPPELLDAAVNFTPAGGTVPPALEVLKPGGTLACAGIYMTPVPELDYQKHLYREKTFRSVTNFTNRDAREFLALAAEIPLRPEVEIFPFEHANEALRKLKEGKINGAGVLRVRE